MALHRPASSRANGARTPQASRFTGDPGRRFLRPQERLPLAATAEGLPALEDSLDGLITNDKFCFTRHSRLNLRPPRRGYPPRKDVGRGGNGETKLDGSSYDGQPQRRRSSLGPGISTPAPVGGSGTGGEFKGGGE